MVETKSEDAIILENEGIESVDFTPLSFTFTSLNSSNSSMKNLKDNQIEAFEDCYMMRKVPDMRCEGKGQAHTTSSTSYPLRSSSSHRRRRRWNGTKPGRIPKKHGYMLRRCPSYSERDTHFDSHLQKIYADNVGENEGILYFQSHGYYDIDEVNIVELFQHNFDLPSFWDDSQGEAYADVSMPLHDELGDGYITLKSFWLQDSSDLIKVDDEEQLKSKKARLRILLDEVEADEKNMFCQEELLVHEAITLIRREKTWISQCLDEAFDSETANFASSALASKRSYKQIENVCLVEASKVDTHALAITPLPCSIDLPPFSGTIYVLKNTIPVLVRGWRKRWFYLDFAQSKVFVYKRSYWKTLKDVVDLQHVVRVARLNKSDLQVEFAKESDQHTMILRTKASNEANLWANLMQYARRKTRFLLDSSATSHKRRPEQEKTANFLLTFMSSTERPRETELQSVVKRPRSNNQREFLDCDARIPTEPILPSKEFYDSTTQNPIDRDSSPKTAMTFEEQTREHQIDNQESANQEEMHLSSRRDTNPPRPLVRRKSLWSQLINRFSSV